jgi:hypothetical protein
VRYDLVLQSYEPLPQSDRDPYAKCQDTTFAGVYLFVGSKWRARDSVATRCGPHRVEENTGTSKREGKYLLLKFRRPEDADHAELNFDRVLIRGDTLESRGEDYGTVRIYVKRH